MQLEEWDDAIATGDVQQVFSAEKQEHYLQPQYIKELFMFEENETNETEEKV